MKDVKLKEKFEKVFEAFFEDAPTASYLEKTSADNLETLHFEDGSETKPKLKNVLILLKQLFIFLPATFFTFYMWMGMMIFGLPTVGISLTLLILVFAPVLMILGIGSIKNIKHWVMPFSVMILGSLIGIGMSSFPFLKEFILNFENAILFFPLALIVAVLSKNLIDNFDEKESI